MEERNDVLGMLDMMIRPGFCVKEEKIVRVNQAAAGLGLTQGMDVASLLQTGLEEYRELERGTLFLTLRLAGGDCGASVSRLEELDVFLLEQEADDQELRAMALAARELRGPLSSVMATAERLFPLTAMGEDPQLQGQVARLNKGLYQILRVLGNMSDANGMARVARQETRELTGFFGELFDRAREVLPSTGLTLRYQGLPGPVYGLVSSEQIERAVLNILSNAVKFTPAGGTVDVTLTRRGHFLRLSVWDSGSGVAEHLRGSVFSRYLRQPAIEDSRYGLGLGMVLIRTAAASHGGAVLLDQPEGKGTRVTMTIDLSRKPDPNLRSQILTVDYTGERDHWLVELADSLPPEAFLGQ